MLAPWNLKFCIFNSSGVFRNSLFPTSGSKISIESVGSLARSLLPPIKTILPSEIFVPELPPLACCKSGSNEFFKTPRGEERKFIVFVTEELPERTCIVCSEFENGGGNITSDFVLLSLYGLG